MLYSRAAEPILIGPWLETLVLQYQSSIDRRRRRAFALVLTAVLAIVTATLWIALQRLESAAYPSDPVKRQALDLCGQTDPTFVRFIASERSACYERLRGLSARPAIDRSELYP